jgi:hypothetical protein
LRRSIRRNSTEHPWLSSTLAHDRQFVTLPYCLEIAQKCDVPPLHTSIVAWQSIEDMTPLERFLIDAAGEDTQLCDLPLPVKSWQSNGEWAVTPAPDPVESSAVLTDWFDRGLVRVYRFHPEIPDLPAEEARAILADPLSWTPECACALVLTKSGLEARPW